MTAVVDLLEVAAFNLGLTALEVRSDAGVREAVLAGSGVDLDVQVRKEQWRAVADRLLARCEAAAKAHSSSGAASHCRACGSPIWWGETETGKRMSLDPLPRPMGNVIRVPQGKHMVLRVLGRSDLPVVGRPAYQSHFVSCPDADQLRRRRERKDRARDEQGRLLACAAPGCTVPLDPSIAAEGWSTHPTCGPNEKRKS